MDSTKIAIVGCGSISGIYFKAGKTFESLDIAACADLAYALNSGRPHRASGELAYHVLDVMQGFLDAAEAGKRVGIESTCERPAPLPTGLEPGHLDP